MARIRWTTPRNKRLPKRITGAFKKRLPPIGITRHRRVKHRLRSELQQILKLHRKTHVSRDLDLAHHERVHGVERTAGQTFPIGVLHGDGALCITRRTFSHKTLGGLCARVDDPRATISTGDVELENRIQWFGRVGICRESSIDFIEDSRRVRHQYSP